MYYSFFVLHPTNSGQVVDAGIYQLTLLVHANKIGRWFHYVMAMRDVVVGGSRLCCVARCSIHEAVGHCVRDVYKTFSFLHDGGTNGRILARKTNSDSLGRRSIGQVEPEVGSNLER